MLFTDSIFETPRAAPSPPSTRSSPSPQGFIVPRVPPPNCPLHVTAGPDGPELPRVSDSPLAVDDERVTRLIKFRLTVRVYFLIVISF